MGAEDLERTETGQDLTLAMVTQSTDARRTVAREHGRTEDKPWNSMISYGSHWARIPSFRHFQTPLTQTCESCFPHIRIHPYTSVYMAGSLRMHSSCGFRRSPGGPRPGPGTPRDRPWELLWRLLFPDVIYITSHGIPYIPTCIVCYILHMNYIYYK